MATYTVLSGESFNVTANSEEEALAKFYVSQGHMVEADYEEALGFDFSNPDDVEEYGVDTIATEDKPYFDLTKFLNERLTDLRSVLSSTDEDDSLHDYLEGCIEAYEIVLATQEK